MGAHLGVIDDSNEHMLTVWDLQKKSKIAEIKVRAGGDIALNCITLQ